MIKRAMLRAIGFYKRRITVHTPARCRFIPTCSQYAYEAIEIHGALVGFFLALGRFLRCNPLFKGGYDPVPGKKR